jgi:glycosyltransferase involved in cell wall biosynthesis
MSAMPDVSVVMGVYNAAATLPATLESVLAQDRCRLEFIVIDDGSTDATASILDRRAARDARLRIVHQQNAGLTRALIRGCELASGEFIARQDAGDVSLPGRLAAQTAFLQQRPGAVMTACGVQFVGPRSEPLYELRRPMLDLDSGLRRDTVATLCGPPHHGATMFRRSAYVHVGGYRAPFAVAQDLDLWLRLVEHGQCLGMNEILYEARLEAGSISSRRRDEQFRLARLALECRQARAAWGDDASLLAASEVRPATHGQLRRTERARFNYFVGSCIRRRNREAAKGYYAAALRDNPLHLKALIHWAMSQ